MVVDALRTNGYQLVKTQAANFSDFEKRFWGSIDYDDFVTDMPDSIRVQLSDVSLALFQVSHLFQSVASDLIELGNGGYPEIKFGRIRSPMPYAGPQGAHRDWLVGNQRRAVEIFAFLSDVTEHNGALRLAKGSHLSEDEDDLTWETITGRAGDILLMDSSCLHYGDKNSTSETRWVLDVHVELG